MAFKRSVFAHAFAALMFVLAACDAQTPLVVDNGNQPISGSALADANDPIVLMSTTGWAVPPAGSITLNSAMRGAISPTYQWTQTPAVGQFSAPNAATTTWTGPSGAETTSVTLEITITDPNSNATGSASVAVTVSPSAQPASLNPSVTSVVSGGNVSLTFTGAPSGATGPSGPPAYAFTQTSPTGPAGTFSDPNANVSQWQAPAVAAPTWFALQGETKQGQVALLTTATILVQPASYNADILPIWQANCASCHGASYPSASFSLTDPNELFEPVSEPDCGTGNRVVPGNPSGSPLYDRLTGTCPGGGPQMPINDPTFFNTNPNLLIEINSWILAGASISGTPTVTGYAIANAQSVVPTTISPGDALALRVVATLSDGTTLPVPSGANASISGPAAVTALLWNSTEGSPIPAFGAEPTAIWISNPGRPDHGTDLNNVVFLVDPGTAAAATLTLTATIPGSPTPTVATQVLTVTAPLTGNPMAGATTYSNNCAACHGATGDGSPADANGYYNLWGTEYSYPAPGLNAVTGNDAAAGSGWDAELFAMAARADMDNGGLTLRQPMPDWLSSGELTTQDFADIYAYLQTQTQ